MSDTTHHDPNAYRDGIEVAITEGCRFAGLHATESGTLVRTLLIGPEGATRLETLVAPDRNAVSIVDLAPAAGWDEREAADLYRVAFAGHDPLRPLVDHDAPLTDWTVPVVGDGTYEVAVGPIHAGVIESGHFRFHVVGDLILHLDAQLFYKHRGLERAAEGQALEQGAAYVARACAACTVGNAVAYAQACEEALGLWPTPDLARARTVLLELERSWNHLNDIAAICAGTGLAAGNSHFASLTERARRLNHALTGHRFLFDTVSVGASRLDLAAHHTESARAELESIHAKAELGWRSLIDNLSFQDRLGGVGTLTPQVALDLGTAGPALRATGIREDARTHSPRLAYDGFQAVVCDAPEGDVRARLEQRMLELRQGFALLNQLLDRPIGPAGALQDGHERPIGVGLVESPRGATSCIVERDRNGIKRLRLRTGSYANWPTVAAVAAGNLLPDFPLINKSFELCYACADR